MWGLHFKQHNYYNWQCGCKVSAGVRIRTWGKSGCDD